MKTSWLIAIPPREASASTFAGRKAAPARAPSRHFTQARPRLNRARASTASGARHGRRRRRRAGRIRRTGSQGAGAGSRRGRQLRHCARRAAAAGRSGDRPAALDAGQGRRREANPRARHLLCYSTTWLADAARATGGRVTTLDVVEKKQAYAKAMLAKAGLDG